MTSHRNASFLTLEGSKSTRTSQGFSAPYSPVASLDVSLDCWQPHRGRRPQTEAAQVLLSYRYTNSSSMHFSLDHMLNFSMEFLFFYF